MEVDFIFFVPFFIGTWLIVTTIMTFQSGWFSLMRRYPDRTDEVAVVKFSHESGYMGNIFAGGMRGILNLSACPSGLRVGIMKAFGPFCKNFFVPWSEITIKRRDVFFMRYAELTLGSSNRTLGIDPIVADRFWRTLPNVWPENGIPPTPKTRSELVSETFKLWLCMTVLGSSFFLIAPRIVSQGGVNPPTIVAILFPAIAFGFFCAYEYGRRSGLNK